VLEVSQNPTTSMFNAGGAEQGVAHPQLVNEAVTVDMLYRSGNPMHLGRNDLGPTPKALEL
jgi:hypothetical protein